MKKVVLAGRLHPAGEALLAARTDVEALVLDDPHQEALAAALPEAAALVVRTARIGGNLIGLAPGLKVVSRHGVGFDNIDLAALNARRIPLTVVGDANALTVAEHAFALMLALARNLRRNDAGMRAGNYAVREIQDCFELAGRRLLIVGFGRIGTRVAKRAAAFEMAITVADPYVPRRVVEGLGHAWVADFRDALPEADIVTLHMPGNADGSAVLGAAEFRAMKPGAVLINCARGTLVDEDALVAALRDGPLSAAGLDVTRQEPPPKDHPLLGLDNVVLTPHAAAATQECFARMARVSVQNALDALDGRLDPGMVVNPAVL